MEAPFTGSVTGSASHLPLRSEYVDRVVAQFLLHHLTGRNYIGSRRSVRAFFEDASRVLRPGGQVLVTEPVVPRTFELAQRLMFPITKRLLATVNFPMVIEYARNTLCAVAKEAGFTVVAVEAIPLGRFVSQVGMRWPTILTPTRAAFFVLQNAGAL